MKRPSVFSEISSLYVQFDMGIVIFSRVSFAVQQMYTSIVSVSNYCLGTWFAYRYNQSLNRIVYQVLCESIRCSGQSGNCFFACPKIFSKISEKNVYPGPMYIHGGLLYVPVSASLFVQNTNMTQRCCSRPDSCLAVKTSCYWCREVYGTLFFGLICGMEYYCRPEGEEESRSRTENLGTALTYEAISVCENSQFAESNCNRFSLPDFHSIVVA